MISKDQFEKKDAVIFDLDGTLANTKKFEKKHKKRHEGFAQEAVDAPVIEKNVERLKKKAEDNQVVILTARSGAYRSETEDWLAKHEIPYDKLVMRPSDDSKTRDKMVKARLLEHQILPRYEVTKAYDDKSKNIKMFRQYGIKAKEV